MIVSRQEAVEIVRGKLDEVAIQYSPPAIGSCQAVQSAVGKPAICKVTITDSWPLRAGGHAVRFSLVEQVPLRLLDRRPWRGYTANPAMAMRDEGEAVSEEWQRMFSQEAHARDGLRRAESRRERLEAELAAFQSQLVQLRRFATECGVDVGSEVRVIERRLGVVERKIERAA
jgi:hypothetical protein